MKRIACVDRAVCAAYGVCVKTCPKSALSIYRGCYAMAEKSLCVGCGLCSKACPAGCITMKEAEEAT